MTVPPSDQNTRAEWREIAEWDWVLLERGDRLHAVNRLLNHATVDDDWYGRGYTECGRAGVLHIPGIFTRMSAKRCSQCCAVTGMPQGSQSPKNIDECRPIAEARIAALAFDERQANE